ncbi:hypothetical protein DSM104443_03512 [Usitatibacter rugosus]|uniref:Cytochrome c domain-containing protein n=1 Tax=Usitatibacter rugosus TaxID=2732067 RepID=A0A6M4GYW2_9PROT|nr:hypothetical protein DSM104443_03512 [Usitatibacter rugosus]
MVSRALAAFAIALGAWLPAFGQTFTGAMSGTWWDASRSGEGQLITFETLGTRNVATLAFFTYTADGRATWHFGNVDYTPGATSLSIPLITGEGPRFGSGYNSGDFRTSPAGTATLEFVSCTQMRMRHSAMPDVTLQLTRLVGPLVGAACGAAAPTGAVTAFAGQLSGGWFNAGRNGEGQFVMFESTAASSSVFLAYFTYTADGRPSWLVGNALFATGARSVVIPLITGSGARFGSAFRATDVTTAPSGSITLEFQDCGNLRFTYTGTQPLTVGMTRLVGPLNGIACTDSTGPSATDTALRFLLTQNGLTGNARAGRTLPSIDDPLPQLGKLLFFSKALSSARDTACASCHHPALGGSDALAVSIGSGAVSADVLGPGRRLAGPARVGRNANSFFNSGLFDAGLFWDSRIESLSKISGRNGSGSGIRTPDSPLSVADPAAGPNLPAAQSRFPVVGAAEMLGNGFPGITSDAAIRNHLAARIGSYGTGAGQLPASTWLARFRTALGSPSGSAEQLITFDQIMNAIAEYERSATFVESAFARYVRGDNGAMTEQAKQGALLFYRPVASGGANCVQCHRGDFMTNEQHHALGFPQVGPGMGDGANAVDDFGRGRQTNLADDRYRYRTPSLLNVEVTAPYGHAGSYATIEEAVAHYFTPDASSQAVVNGRTWCRIAPFDSDPGCNATQASVTANSQAAIAKLRADQAANAATSMPVLDPTRFGSSAIGDLSAFLRTLTDPCLKDRSCYGKWIPRPDEAPDGLQLNATDSSGRPF